MSYDLEYVVMGKSKDEMKECFLLGDIRDRNKEVELCAWRSALREGQNMFEYVKWFQDNVKEFKEKCRGKRLILTDDPEVTKMKDMADMNQRENMGGKIGGDKDTGNANGLEKLRNAISVNIIK